MVLKITYDLFCKKNADETGLSLEYIQQICSLKLKKTFSLATLGRIADVLDVPLYKMLK